MPITAFFDYPTLRQLAGLALAALAAEPGVALAALPATAPTPGGAGGRERRPAGPEVLVDDLSDAEVDAMLEELMESGTR